MSPKRKADIIAGLQTDILRLQGLNSSNDTALDFRLGPIKDSFPNATFPLGCTHEFLTSHAEDVAATYGFIAALLTSLSDAKGTLLWISSSRTLFPPALRNFGIQPDRFIFIDLQKEKDVLWAMDEALKCGALAAVVGELREISFTNSKRLQLAVEQSGVTGFILRNDLRKLDASSSVSRWKITPLASESIDDLPGLSFPKWRVELLRIRNGKPGVWHVQWSHGRFQFDSTLMSSQPKHFARAV